MLHCLVERPGQLVTKDVLLERVWPGTVVGDAVLKVCVREIRKALGDRVDAPRFVATVHRRGYRFIADVTDSDADRRARGEAPRTRRRSPPSHCAARGTAAPPISWAGSRCSTGSSGLEAAWRGSRQVVFVTGEPGIGKTGVVEAFLERVAADPRVWIAQGQCVETYGTSEPYLPVLDALGRLCRESGGDWLVTLLRRHAPTWLVQMPWLLDARRPRRAAAGAAGRHARADAPRDGRGGRGADGARRRWSWSSRTCTGVTRRPSICSPSSHGAASRRGCS